MEPVDAMWKVVIRTYYCFQPRRSQQRSSRESELLLLPSSKEEPLPPLAINIGQVWNINFYPYLTVGSVPLPSTTSVSQKKLKV